MQITKNAVVKIHYTLSDEEGNEIDSSVGKAPLEYVHGTGALIPGLEAMLEGKEEGAKFKAVVEPQEAYGDYNKNLIIEVPRAQFDSDAPIEIGMSFQAGTNDGGSMLVRVIGINDDVITVDGNHELAGMRLTFDVEVVSVGEQDFSSFDDEYDDEGGCGGGCSGCSGGCGCGW
ncbi:MAG: FKBP-type peptidyl-prolyl cis-trans isomerase [Treponema sp.]